MGGEEVESAFLIFFVISVLIWANKMNWGSWINLIFLQKYFFPKKIIQIICCEDKNILSRTLFLRNITNMHLHDSFHKTSAR